MRNILILEDRKFRQDSYNINLLQFDCVKNITEEFSDDKKDCQEFLDKFLITNDIMDTYSVIMVHESIYPDKNIEIIRSIKAYCKKNNKQLVLFSGGNNKFYSNNILTLDSKEFYSKNLELFLADCIKNNPNLLILGYGEYWKLNILLNILERINIFTNINNNEEVADSQDFYEECKISMLTGLVEYDNLQIDENEDILFSEIQRLKNILNIEINNLVYL